MQTYSSTDQFYSTMQHLFERIRTRDPNPIDKLAYARLVVRLSFVEPEAEILVNGRQKPVSISFGNIKNHPIPDLEAEMTTETLHMILMHNLSLKSAIAYRKIKVYGMLWKTNSLAAILENGRELYPVILRERGLNL